MLYLAPVSLSMERPGMGSCAPDFLLDSPASRRGRMSLTDVSLDVEPNSSAQDTCFSPWLARLCVFLYFTPSASPKEAGRLLVRGPDVDSGGEEDMMEGKNTAVCQGFNLDFWGAFSGFSGDSTNERAASKVGFSDDDDVGGDDDGEHDDEVDDEDDDDDDDPVGDKGDDEIDIGGGVGEDDNDGEEERADFLEQLDSSGNVGEGVREKRGFSKGSGMTIAL